MIIPNDELPDKTLVLFSIHIDQTEVDFTVDTGRPDLPPYFCFGIRKSGSTLLNKIVGAMAHACKFNRVDVPGRMFKLGKTVSDWKDSELSDIVAGGNVYLGFRALPAKLASASLVLAAPKVFMFRDPRDALVSQYFSDAYSHDLPEVDGKGRDLFLKKREVAQSADIDEWVLEHCANMRKTLAAFLPLLGDAMCLKLRYEDYVFQKRRMIYKIMRHFEWPISEDVVDRILALVEYVPEAEDQKRFIRKAIPGDHVVKLKKSTIGKLNHRLGDVLTAYDYI